METEVVKTMKVLAAARTAHEVNRAYCVGIGDCAQLSWEDAPEWQRASAVVGVQAIVDDPNTTPEQSHEGWLKQKEADGWKYGSVKDPEKKEHPCFVAYLDLPKAQQVKDTLFGATVRGVLAEWAKR